MERDPVREKIRDLIWRRGLNMREASVAIGRSVSYMHQFLERGTPRVLGFRDSEKLAGLLGCDVGELRHETMPKRKPWTREGSRRSRGRPPRARGSRPSPRWRSRPPPAPAP